MISWSVATVKAHVCFAGRWCVVWGLIHDLRPVSRQHVREPVGQARLALPQLKFLMCPGRRG